MSCYGPLAAWYDRLTGDVPYSEFADYYEAEFHRHGGEFRFLLDLCCGTGTLTCEMARRGYEMIAVDASVDMLMQAQEKSAGLDPAPLFLCQEASALDLYGTVDAAYCSLDGMNYIPPSEHPVNGNPCCQCAACRGIADGSVLDVVELDAASNNGVDNVRALREEAVFSPASVRKRVYIIDEVHMLSTSAFNALLKILEEPPEHLMFILATTELQKVPATILSRCQRHSSRYILSMSRGRRALILHMMRRNLSHVLRKAACVMR